MRCLCRLALSLLVVVAGLTDATPHGQESALWEVTIPQLYYCVSDYVDFIGCPSPTTQWSEMLSISPRNGSTLWEVTSQQPGVATGGVNFQFCPQRPNDAYLVSGAGLPSQSVLLSALNKSTGTVYWTAPVANGTTPMMRCSNDGQLIYLVAYATVSTFEASTGTARWSLNVQGAQVYNFLEVADVHANATSLIFIDAQGVHRVDARTGKPLPFALRLQSNDMLLGTVGPLVIIQKANTSVVATTVEGHAVWWWLVGFVPQQSFAQLFGDVLLFGETNDNVVEAINATTGKRLWTRPIGMDVPTLAAVTRDLVVLSVVGPMLQNNTLYSYASWEAVSLATGELRWALYNITTGCADNFITANYFGVTNDAGDAIVAFKVADGTNRTLPLDAACGNGLIVTETRQLLLVQNNSAAIAYSKTW